MSKDAAIPYALVLARGRVLGRVSLAMLCKLRAGTAVAALLRASVPSNVRWCWLAPCWGRAGWCCNDHEVRIQRRGPEARTARKRKSCTGALMMHPLHETHATRLHDDLLRPEAFAAIAPTQKISLAETHISWVFLLEARAMLRSMCAP
jgi:hypothetical protein